jgi:hypothetical protein
MYPTPFGICLRLQRLLPNLPALSRSGMHVSLGSLVININNQGLM